MEINDTKMAKWYGKSRSMRDVSAIVIHYTANSGKNATAKGNANYFQNCDRKASAHYVVDTDEIYRCVPDERVAYAVGGNRYTDCAKTGGGALYGRVTNENSINIEMVSGTDDVGPFVLPQTVANTVWLVKGLLKKYPHIKTVCRHFDVTGKPCPKTHCITPSGVESWQRFLEELKEEAMTEAERKEFDALKNEVSELKKTNRVYHYTEELPDFAKPTIQKLLDMGIYRGESDSDLNLPESLMRTLVINDRSGMYK